MLGWYKDFFINTRFYLLGMLLCALFAASIAAPWIENVAYFMSMIAIVYSVWEISTLYATRQGIQGKRILPEKFSLADLNPYRLDIQSQYSKAILIEIHDELPVQLQARDRKHSQTLRAREHVSLESGITPLVRGEYHFGTLNILASHGLRLFARRYRLEQNQMVKVYPSFLQLRQYRLAAISNRLQDLGIKKIRRIGNASEFEHIKDYVQGDDPRKINWKATARRQKLMTNQYQEERSQNVYCIIDKGRPMKMPFDGLKLIDYSINAALVLAQVAISKQDKAGLITFSDKISSVLPAGKQSYQMSRFLETLYNQKSLYKESNFELLYQTINSKIKKRSLIFLFTHFDTLPALNRQMRYLKAISKRHLLIPIFFENSKLIEFTQNQPETLEEIYQQVTAENILLQTQLIQYKLRSQGIQSISSQPNNLKVASINKYIEIKARGLR